MLELAIYLLNSEIIILHRIESVEYHNSMDIESFKIRLCEKLIPIFEETSPIVIIFPI